MKITVIGSSAASWAAIDQIRQADQDAEITLVLPEGVLPYDRSVFPRFMGREIRETAVLCAAESFYAGAGVNVISGVKVSRINVKRHQVGLEDKSVLVFDKLLVTDLGFSRALAVKGNHRRGVWDIARLSTLKDVLKNLPFMQTIAIQAGTPAGIRAALVLQSAGKDILVKILEGQPRTSELTSLAQEAGLRLIAEGVNEILGDSEMKALKLESGKILACDMFLTDAPVPDNRILEEAGLIGVEAEDVFLADAARGDFLMDVEAVKLQGKDAVGLAFRKNLP